MKDRGLKAFLMEDGPFNSILLEFHSGVRVEGRVQASNLQLYT